MQLSTIPVKLCAMRTWIAAIGSVALLGALAVEVVAADEVKFGVVAGSPKNGAVVKRTSRPTFRVRVQEPGSTSSFAVFMRASSKPGKIDGGLIRYGYIARLSRVRPGLFEIRPDPKKRYTYPTYWLNKQGTYYWQAYVVYCLKNGPCNHASSVRRLVVK